MRYFHYQSVILFLIILTIFLPMNLLFATFNINGKIIDSQTGEPVGFANVFLANTTVGGMSDNYGNFSFRANLPPGIYQLVIRHISYELLVTDLDFYAKLSYTQEFKLKPRVLKGRMVVVEAQKPVEWEKNLKKFIKMFIGSTENAKKTRILNPEVLDFETDSVGTFLAYSDSIIKIENNSLGYDLDIVLEDFQAGEGKIRYIIYPQFKEKSANSLETQNKWKLARYNTFEGSFKHFLRSLAANRLEAEGFLLKNGFKRDHANYVQDRPERPYSIKTITVFEKSENIKITGKLKLLHKSNLPTETASFEILKDTAIIDTLGNILNQYSILASGKWSEERIADLLPQDYQMNK